MRPPVKLLARLKADYQDPYILRTHLGTLECRLCLTLHVNEGSYLAHTQGKKHQTNLARRAAQDNKSQSLLIAPAPAANQVKKKVFVKIGRPGECSVPSGTVLDTPAPRLESMSVMEWANM
jgi:hypothetical protein